MYLISLGVDWEDCELLLFDPCDDNNDRTLSSFNASVDGTFNRADFLLFFSFGLDTLLATAFCCGLTTVFCGGLTTFT